MRKKSNSKKKVQQINSIMEKESSKSSDLNHIEINDLFQEKMFKKFNEDLDDHLENEKKSTYRSHRIALLKKILSFRYITVFLLILIVIFSTQKYSMATRLWEIIMKTYEKYTEINYVEKQSHKNLEFDFNNIIPKEFEIIQEIIEEHHYYALLKSNYTKETELIVDENNKGTVRIDTEDKITKKIVIRGVEILIVYRDDDMIIAWNDDRYRYTIISNEKEPLLHKLIDRFIK